MSALPITLFYRKIIPLRYGIDTEAEWDSHIPLLHPDDHEETRRVWSTCLRIGCAGEVSFRVRNAEGEYRWFLSRAEPVRAADRTLLYWIGVNLDIEERKQLQSYPWPGNIRELQNVIERSVIVCETETFTVDESWLSQRPLDTKSGNNLFFSDKVAATEKEIIEEALRESLGRIFGPSGAAAKLGIARSTLESKIRSLNIDKNRFKAPPGT
jgi:PAS fold/Bacterial regulatory protein, Fis family